MSSMLGLYFKISKDISGNYFILLAYYVFSEFPDSVEKFSAETITDYTN